MTSEVTRGGGIGGWLSERLGMQPLIEAAKKKVVPVHKHSMWYYMGGIALILMLIQAVTGALLMVYYVPDIAAAHASILKINSQTDFGWFIRSLHSWGANLAILVLFVHLFSTYFMKAYRKPRELTWLSGVACLAVVMAFGFTGYLLPWDKVAFFATKIGLDIASKLPLVGGILSPLLRGGDAIGQGTLSRFFVMHVAVLPAVLLMVVGGHLLLVQNHGISEPESVKRRETREYEKFFPNFFFKDVLVWLLTVNTLAVLVTLFPWGVGPEANPFAPAPIGIKPEWYFLSMFQFLKLLPPQVGPIEGELAGIGCIGLVAAMLAFMPFFDAGPSKSRSKLATGFGIVLLAVLILLTAWGAFS